MVKYFFSTLILFVFSYYLSAQPSDYYTTATGTGYVLKSQLHDIIDGHSEQSYASLWTHFQTTDVDNYFENDGSPLDMYSENPDGPDSYNFNWGSDQCGNYSGEGSCYNREHSFPKSWFNDASPMYSDLFHLVLSDGYVNGQRGNYPFGEVGSADWTSLNGSKKGDCSYPGYSGTVFEPIDEFKGDFARIYFYMATRYEDVLHSWSSPVLDGSNDQVYTDWYLNMIIEWHTNDPVSQKEIDRNNAIYGIQGNRNPFVDHPQWVYTIWGGAPVTNEPSNYPAAFDATASSVTTIDLSWTDATGEHLPDGYLIAANKTGNFTAPVDGVDPSTDGDLSDGNALVKISYGQQSAVFNNLDAETTYFFKIWSYANMGTQIDFKTDGNAPETSAQTASAPNLLFSDDFESDLSEWMVVNDENANAEVLISNLWSGAESTSNAAVFDAPMPEEQSYFISTIEHQFQNVYNLSVDLWYYFEDYRGGEIRVLLNDQIRQIIYTEGQGNIQITEATAGTWQRLTLDLTEVTQQEGDYTLKIRGESKCSSTWTDRVAVDQIKVYGEQGTGIGSGTALHAIVFPNPAQNLVEVHSQGAFTVKVMDMNGRVMLQEKATGHATLPVHELERGFYIVSIYGQTYIENHRIVIQ